MREIFQRDEANGRRAFKLAKKSNEAMNKLSQAMVMNTKAIEENGKPMPRWWTYLELNDLAV